MKKTVCIVLVVLTAALGAWAIWGGRADNPAPLPETTQAENAIKSFGGRLKNVPLAAEPGTMRGLIQTEYGPYVTPLLLARWMEDPAHAPGRETSSPWPERIEVKTLAKVGDYYEVSGEIVLMTSDAVARGGDAGRTPVYLTLAKMDGRWLIADYQISLE